MGIGDLTRGASLENHAISCPVPQTHTRGLTQNAKFALGWDAGKSAKPPKTRLALGWINRVEDVVLVEPSTTTTSTMNI